MLSWVCLQAKLGSEWMALMVTNTLSVSRQEALPAPAQTVSVTAKQPSESIKSQLVSRLESWKSISLLLCQSDEVSDE
jgi:hypothetical protein